MEIFRNMKLNLISMKLIKKSILLLALAGGTFLSGGKAYAQQTLVDVRVDSAAILIGEQTVYI